MSVQQPSQPTQAATAAGVNNHINAVVNNTASSKPVKVQPRVFHSNIPSMGYVFKAGKRASFINGKYITDIQYEIDELDAEIAMGHPMIYIKADEPPVELIEPMEALRAKFVKEYVEQQAKNTLKSNDVGTSTQGKLNPASSTDIQEGMASGMPAGSGGIKINIGKAS